MRRNACGFIETPVPGKLLLLFDSAKPELNLIEISLGIAYLDS